MGNKDINVKNIEPTIPSTKICKIKTKKNNLLNLNKITLEKDKLIYKNKNKTNPKIKTIIFDLDNMKQIGKGGYGEVYEISTKDKKKSIVGKFFHDDKKAVREINIIKMLKKMKIDCHLIDAKPFTKKTLPPFIIMNKFDGDLYSIKGKFSLRYVDVLLKSFIKLFKCLVDNGLGYMDIKMENILYKCIDDKNIIIKIGDLGSINLLGESNSISTAIPFENIYDKTIKSNEKGMVYLLGLTILDTFTTDKEINMFYSNKFMYELNEILFYEKLMHIIKNNNLHTLKLNNGRYLDDFILNMLNVEPKERFSFEQSSHYLNNK
jgi:serine/threonine protein kinase